MLIFLDGTFCVGKTTTANRIVKKCPDLNVKILESDEYWEKFTQKIINDYGKPEIPPDLEMGMPQINSRFNLEFRSIINEALLDENSVVIVDMALTETVCKEVLFDYFSTTRNDVIHIILTASSDSMKKRIYGSSRNDKVLPLSELSNALSFLNSNYEDAVRIDTNSCDFEEVTDRIIEIIRSNLP